MTTENRDSDRTTEAPASVVSTGGFGKWRVHGVCFVPMEAEAIGLIIKFCQ